MGIPGAGETRCLQGLRPEPIKISSLVNVPVGNPTTLLEIRRPRGQAGSFQSVDLWYKTPEKLSQNNGATPLRQERGQRAAPA